MKYALIIPDGCADEPQESLGGRTPLEAAKTPAMDAVARAGVVGRADNCPPSLPAGSDVATLSLFGYDPMSCYTGRAPLEAAAKGLELGPNDWAVRCNLVTIEDRTMRSFTAGQIENDDASALMEACQATLAESFSGPGTIEFHSGVSYRNLMIYRPGHGRAAFSPDTRTRPPHDLTDQEVLDDYPRGPGSDLLVGLMNESVTLFSDHPVNRRRCEEGKPPATNIWLWGQGSRPALEPFAEKYGVRGVMITAVDLLRGIASFLGWPRIEVPGATGYVDTDYGAKGRHAVDALREFDLVCVHVEAPDEASHEGDGALKVETLERIDEHIVGPLHASLEAQGDYRIIVSPDHPTLLRTKTHSHGSVPFAVAGTGVTPDTADHYGDTIAAKSEIVFARGHEMMGWFLSE